MDNCSMFSKIFFEIVSNIDSGMNEDLPEIKRELESIKNGSSPNLREGIQYQISLFFDCVRKQFKKLSEQNRNFYQLLSDVVEAVGLISYQSIKKNRGINYPNKESLKKIIGDYKENKPKANEKFSLLLFPVDKKMSITTISELVGFIYVLLAVFCIDLKNIQNMVVEKLRQYVKIYVNNEAFIRQVYNGSFNKWAVVDKEIYDYSSVIDKFSSLLKVDDRQLMLCKLIFILLYFTDCKAPTQEAKDSFVQWINNIQDEKLQIANGYSKYLWIRYRRLPEDELSAECLNGFTVDNIYILPSLYANNKASSRKLFDGFFDRNSQSRKRRAIIGQYGQGKTALLNTIISMVAINSNYARSDKNISTYFINYYSSLEEMLGFKVFDVFPIIVSCEKFDSFIKEWRKNNDTEPTFLDFAYYIIVSYSDDLNVIGEKNEGWYEKWINTFTTKQFETIFKGAIEDDKALFLIDDFENISGANKKTFENMFDEILHKYGSKCEIIFTATDENLLPEAITKINGGLDIFKLGEFNTEDEKRLFSRFYAYFKNPTLIQEKKREITFLCDMGLDDIKSKELEFEKLIARSSKDACMLLDKNNPLGDNPIFKSPLALCKLAQYKDNKSGFNIETMDESLMGKLLPAISNDDDIAAKLCQIIPRKLFDAIDKAKKDGNSGSLLKFQYAINTKSRYIKNLKVKSAMENCNRIISLMLESER